MRKFDTPEERKAYNEFMRRLMHDRYWRKQGLPPTPLSETPRKYVWHGDPATPLHPNDVLLLAKIFNRHMSDEETLEAIKKLIPEEFFYD